MKSLPETTQLTLDDKQFAVSELPQPIQALVELYDDWRDRERVLISDINMVQRGMRDLQAELHQQMQQHIAATAIVQPETPPPSPRTEVRKQRKTR